VTVAPAQLSEVIASRHDAITLSIVDTVPHGAPDAARIAAMTDLIVIPGPTAVPRRSRTAEQHHRAPGKLSICPLCIGLR
jgi:hypothetical protein